MGDYSSGDEASLPADTTNLDHVYDATDLSNVQTNDTNYVDQTGSAGYEIHQYKDSITASNASVTWIGKSSLAPSTSKVQLQVYKVAAPAAWQDVSGAGASNNVAAADTDFTLSGTIATADYLDSGVITFRVYQSATSYWPVTGVTKPQHWYPFKLTGNATDQGSTGGLDLSVGAGTPTYSSGLVLDGSSYLTRAAHADLLELGTTWSILLDFTFTGSHVFNYYYPIAGGQDSTWRALLWDQVNGQAPCNTSLYFNGLDALSSGSYNNDTRYQLVYTANGTGSSMYINGSHAVDSGYYTIGNDLTYPFCVGFVSLFSLKFTGTICYVGILKGSSWSATDVSNIYSSLT